MQSEYHGLSCTMLFLVNVWMYEDQATPQFSYRGEWSIIFCSVINSGIGEEQSAHWSDINLTTTIMATKVDSEIEVTPPGTDQKWWSINPLARKSLRQTLQDMTVHGVQQIAERERSMWSRSVQNRSVPWQVHSRIPWCMYYVYFMSVVGLISQIWRT